VDKDEILKYWIETSDSDFSAMEHLFEKEDYTWALFVGHLVIEKLLKALYVKYIDITPPFIHDLVRLAEKAGVSLTEDRKDSLDTISTFNLSTRYDDYRREFYKKCTKSFTDKWIKNIKELRTWLKDSLLT